METAIKKAGVLIEALPYIKKFQDEFVVIKIGGNAMLDKRINKLVFEDIALMKLIGMRPILIHGGGPFIDDYLLKLGLEKKFSKGLRVTDEKTMEIVEMVLSGKINSKIVKDLNALGLGAVGLSGKDADLILGEKIEELGFVGSVEKINPSILQTLYASSYLPVISPVAISKEGESLNINADLVAGKIAASLQAKKLVFMTDIQGILEEGRLISSLDEKKARDLIGRKVISGGMLPKVESALEALKSGVANVHIIDGRQKHSLLLEIFTQEGIGSMFCS